jgi:hypothetical protein
VSLLLGELHFVTSYRLVVLCAVSGSHCDGSSEPDLVPKCPRLRRKGLDAYR